MRILRKYPSPENMYISEVLSENDPPTTLSLGINCFIDIPGDKGQLFRFVDMSYSEIKFWAYSKGYDGVGSAVEDRINLRYNTHISFDSLSRKVLSAACKSFVKNYEKEFPESKIVNTLLIVEEGESFKDRVTLSHTFLDGDWTKFNGLYINDRRSDDPLQNEFLAEFTTHLPLRGGTPDSLAILRKGRFNQSVKNLISSIQTNVDGLIAHVEFYSKSYNMWHN